MSARQRKLHRIEFNRDRLTPQNPKTLHSYLLIMGVFACCLAGNGCGLGKSQDYPLRNAVLTGEESWTVYSNEHVLVYTTDIETGKEYSRKAVNAWKQAGTLFGMTAKTTEDSKPVAVYLVENTGTWSRILQDYQLKQEGISMLSGNEMLVLANNSQAYKRDSVPHEMIHYMVWKEGLNLPLVLEEGLALHFGWDVNLSYHLANGDIVEQKISIPESKSLYSFAELESVKQYPGDPVRMIAFYYQANRLMKALVELLGTEKTMHFIRACGKSEKDWKDVLQSGYNVSDEQLAWLIKVAGSLNE